MVQISNKTLIYSKVETILVFYISPNYLLKHTNWLVISLNNLKIYVFIWKTYLQIYKVDQLKIKYYFWYLLLSEKPQICTTFWKLFINLMLVVYEMPNRILSKCNITLPVSPSAFHIYKPSRWFKQRIIAIFFQNYQNQK